MGQISLAIPVSGASFATEGPKVETDLTLLQNVINGNLDSTNIAAALAQSAGVNQAGLVSKGAVAIAASETRTNTAYGTLTTPDQVTGIVLPANGLITVRYQATWQESVGGAGRAAIFIGANQQKVAINGGVGPEAAQTGGVPGGTNLPLFSTPFGLVSEAGGSAAAYSGDVTTGQAVGFITNGLSVALGMDLNGTTFTMTQGASGPPYYAGGACMVFAAAGTYTVSVQFKSSSGSVTASNRKLWVKAESFA